MHYEHTTNRTFIQRPNRFIAKVEIGGSVETVHVKNTGQCNEILTGGRNPEPAFFG